MDYNDLAEAIVWPFAQKYYRIFDFNRAELANFYDEESMLSFNGEKCKGKENIVTKLTSLPQCQHTINTVDCLPFSLDLCMLVLVTGEITYVALDDKRRSIEFTQVFHLVPRQGRLCVSSDLFRACGSRTAAAAPQVAEEVVERVLTFTDR